ncbi:TauD/TfdA family dioxygenase [Legionella israelensis]|uniref:TauD/TfdA family dioxygenase n=1 Tax=Legionella israelensis TaxID=454 RepID=UPI00117E0F6B|nr:TauD/TfdA family dioxygenase [Legionella israelensis]QDP71789.1 TauD/TfdA family dioxygenase [Legionella israelensis]
MNRLFNNFDKNKNFPIIIQPVSSQEADIDHLINEIKQSPQELLKLLNTYGAVCFRGFKAVNTEKFQQLIQVAELGELFNYDFGFRYDQEVAKGVVTSPFASPLSSITPHSEKAHSGHYPDYICFYSKEAARLGGQTPLTDNLKLWQCLPEQLKQKFATHKIYYKWHFFGDSLSYRFLRWLAPPLKTYSWQFRFKTMDSKAVEMILKREGFHFQWKQKNGNLSAGIKLPAYRIHPFTHEPMWFNHVSHMNTHYHFYRDLFVKNYKFPARVIMKKQSFLPCTAYWEDGSNFSISEIEEVHQAIRDCTTPFTWQKDDILLVDNLRCMHAKRPHEGKRELLLTLLKRKNNLHD